MTGLSDCGACDDIAVESPYGTIEEADAGLFASDEQIQWIDRDKKNRHPQA